MKHYLLLCLISLGNLIHAQNVGINSTGAAANSSSGLDIDFTDRGILIPRMTAAQIAAIASPATGLLAYQTNGIAGFYYYTGSAWLPLFGWGILGNAGTTAGTHFIGTTDAQALVFKTNNTEWMRLLSTGNLGIGGSPNTSSLLDVTSTSKGVLLPRMTAAQIAAIASPATGLLAFQTDGASGFYYYDGSVWRPLLNNSVTSASGWGMTGNTGTTAGTNFLGTTDARDLVIKTTNVERVRVKTGTGYVGIGNISAVEQLQITENFRLPATACGSVGEITGAIFSDANRYIHNYGTNNFFAGVNAGQICAIGGAGSRNVGVGVNSLNKIAAGTDNTATGYNTLANVTTGSRNTAIGSSALNTSTGSNNTAVGNAALSINTNASNNSAFGTYALTSNATGANNTASGYSALNTNDADYNTATGYNALYNNTSGTNNVALGDRTGLTNTIGNQNTYIGSQTDGSSFAFSNSTALGYGTSVDASNKVRVGNASVTSIGGQVGWTTFSDKRIKENVQEDVKGLDFIMKLRPVTYTYNTTKTNALLRSKAENKSNSDIESIRFSGFLAQDVEQASIESGYNFSGVDKPKTENGVYGLRYAEFVVPIIKAMQEQQALLEQQQKQIETLTKELETMKQKK